MVKIPVCELCGSENLDASGKRQKLDAIKFNGEKIGVCHNCLVLSIPLKPLPPWHDKARLTGAQDRELRQCLDSFKAKVCAEIKRSGTPPDLRTCAYWLGIKGKDNLAARYRNEAVAYWNSLNKLKFALLPRQNNLTQRQKELATTARKLREWRKNNA